MKRTISNIVNTVSKKTAIYLIPYNLNDSLYSIWLAENYRYADVYNLREIDYASANSEKKVTINTQYINSKDYIIEIKETSIFIKFIKENFEYEIDDRDEIILTGNFEKYA